MLSESKIIALYCIVDDVLKAMHHQEDKKVRVSDSEVITTAFVAVLYFGGHLDNARHFMQMQGYAPHMLEKLHIPEQTEPVFRSKRARAKQPFLGFIFRYGNSDSGGSKPATLEVVTAIPA